MLWITNSSAPAALSAGSTIPFNSTVYSTNDNAALYANTVQITSPGMYMTHIQAVLSSTDAVTTTVQLYAQGNAVNNASMTVDIPAGGTSTVTMKWPVNVTTANNSVASVYWALSSAATIDSVSAGISKIV